MANDATAVLVHLFDGSKVPESLPQLLRMKMSLPSVQTMPHLLPRALLMLVQILGILESFWMVSVMSLKCRTNLHLFSVGLRALGSGTNLLLWWRAVSCELAVT